MNLKSIWYQLLHSRIFFNILEWSSILIMSSILFKFFLDISQLEKEHFKVLIPIIIIGVIY
jgi:hypothetical protein